MGGRRCRGAGTVAARQDRAHAAAVELGVLSNGDEERRVARVLREHGIYSCIEFSQETYVVVPEEQRRRAAAIARRLLPTSVRFVK